MRIVGAIARLNSAIEKGRRRNKTILMAHAPKPPAPMPNRDQRWKNAKRLLQIAGVKAKIKSYGPEGPVLRGVKHRKLGRISLPWGNAQAGLRHTIDHISQHRPDLSKLARMRGRKWTSSSQLKLINRSDDAFVSIKPRHRADAWLVSAYRRRPKD